MEDKTKFIDEMIKNVSLKKIEEIYEKDIERNKVLYKIIYGQITRNVSVRELNRLYGNIGILIFMKILTDNNIPIPKDLEKSIYFNSLVFYRQEEKKSEDFFKLFLIIIIILLIVKNFF